jgi:hypothetical protein
MANTNAPFGLRPVCYLNGAPWNGQARRYYVPSSDTFAYYMGDVVSSVANGSTLNGSSAVELTTHAGSRGAAWTTGDTQNPLARGVVVGFGTALATPQGSIPVGADPRNLDIAYVPATKTYDYYLWVVDDPNVIFEAQTDTIANTAFNKNAPLYVAAAPTAPNNQSASYVQGGSANAGSGYPLKIMGAPNYPTNSLLTPGTYAVVYVMINLHELKSSGTAGV